MLKLRKEITSFPAWPQQAHAEEEYLEAGQWYERARLAIQNGSEDIAVIELRKVVNRAPMVAEGHKLLVLTLLYGKKLKEAESALASALKKLPDNPDLKQCAAEITTRKSEKQRLLVTRRHVSGRLRRLMRRRKMVIRMGLLTILLLAVLMTVATFVGRIPFPQWATPVATSGESVEELKKQNEVLAQTVEELRKKLNDSPAMPAASPQSGTAAGTGAKPENTKSADFTEVRQSFETQKWLQAAEGLLAFDKTQFSDEDARQWETLFSQFAPTAALALYSDGIGAFRAGQWQKADALLSVVIRLKPDRTVMAWSLYNLAVARTQTGNDAQAIEPFQTILKDYPEQEAAKYTPWRMEEAKKKAGM